MTQEFTHDFATSSIRRTKHLLFIDTQDVLVLFAVATVCHLLFHPVKLQTIMIHGAFMALAFGLYVHSRLFRCQSDNTIFLAVASFILYRICCGDLLGDSVTGPQTSPSNASHGIIALIFLCTGIRLKLILALIVVAITGVSVRVILSEHWQTVTLDLPLLFYFILVGALYYYAFFCAGVEICRVRHRPLRALRELPVPFFREFEPLALGSLPLTPRKKHLSREEHLYILLRITQTEAFRHTALQLIADDAAVEARLNDKERLERAFLRSALIQFHLKRCPNSTLRHIVGLSSACSAKLASTTTRSTGVTTSNGKFSADLAASSKLGKGQPPPPSGSAAETGRASTGTEGRSRLRRELSFYQPGGCVGIHGPIKDHASLEVLASKVVVSGQQSLIASRDLPRRQQLALSSHLSSGTAAAAAAAAVDHRSSLSKHASDQTSGSLVRTVTVGTVTFPALDVARARKRTEKSHVTLETKTKDDGGGEEGSPERPWQRYQSTTKTLYSLYSGHDHMESRLEAYDGLLGCTANPVWDPISIRIDNRLRILQLTCVRRCCPFLTRFARWLQGVQAVMIDAQWHHRPSLPKIGMWGKFVDLKIERWYLAWVSPIQVRETLSHDESHDTGIMLRPSAVVCAKARQYILLRPLVITFTVLYLLIVWNIFMTEAMTVEASSSRETLILNVVLYLGVRSFFHIVVLVLMTSLDRSQPYEGTLNSHYFKRRAALLGLWSLCMSILDTLMHQLFFPQQCLMIPLLTISFGLFPVFTQLTTLTHIWVVIGTSFLTFVCLPGFANAGLPFLSTVICVAWITIMQAVWFVFMSKCIAFNYRQLFCRYVLPYLLYLDALQPLVGFSGSSSSALSSSSSSSSSHSSFVSDSELCRSK